MVEKEEKNEKDRREAERKCRYREQMDHHLKITNLRMQTTVEAPSCPQLRLVLDHAIEKQTISSPFTSSPIDMLTNKTKKNIYIFFLLCKLKRKCLTQSDIMAHS